MIERSFRSAESCSEIQLKTRIKMPTISVSLVFSNNVHYFTIDNLPYSVCRNICDFLGEDAYGVDPVVREDFPNGHRLIVWLLLQFSFVEFPYRFQQVAPSLNTS